MQTTRVIVLPYDSKWKTDFENIRKEIEDAAGDLIIALNMLAVLQWQGFLLNLVLTLMW